MIIPEPAAPLLNGDAGGLLAERSWLYILYFKQKAYGDCRIKIRRVQQCSIGRGAGAITKRKLDVTDGLDACFGGARL